MLANKYVGNESFSEMMLWVAIIHAVMTEAATHVSTGAGGAKEPLMIDDPINWPPTPNDSCHAATPSGRIIDISNVSHAQCAAECVSKACGCFDMTAAGSCIGTEKFWGFRKSSDRTAYTNATVPAPPPQPPVPEPKGPFSLHPTLGDNVVLQRAPARAAIFGWGRTGGTTITAHFRGQAYSGVVAPNSSRLDALMWRIELPATPASTSPENITVTADNTSMTLANVLFGDVWMCGGQSNMAVPLDETFEWFHQDVANDTDYPINVLEFPHVNGLNHSTIHVANDDTIPWLKSTYDNLTSFSAVWCGFSQTLWCRLDSHCDRIAL